MAKQAVISIVDDDFSVREVALDLMRSLGLVAEAFASAEEFLCSDALHTTLCLIADVRLPGMDGFELHRQLILSGNGVATILITASPNDKNRASALAAGAAAYLAKPFSVDELISCIDAVLGRRKAS